MRIVILLTILSFLVAMAVGKTTVMSTLNTRFNAAKKLAVNGICPVNTTDCQGPQGADTCCNNQAMPGMPAESCCPDPTNGGICCVAETTMCCPPNPGLDLPSRCCPRWYVCCNGGRYGCCDPDTMNPMESNIAFAILEETSIWTDSADLFSLHIDMATGNYTQHKLLPGGFNDDGEITRKFMYAQNENLFYMLQANFTGPKRSGDPDRQIKLYKIDPISLSTTVKVVAGADDEVTGYKYIETAKTILMATKSYNKTTGKLAGYKFYHVSTATAKATLVSTVLNPTSGDTYAGWFHEVSPDMKTVYRLGNQDVTTSENFGIGVLNLTTAFPPPPTWVLLPVPAGRLNYANIHLVPSAPIRGGEASSEPTFISLAPGDGSNITNYENLAIYMWNLAAPQHSKKMGEWPNAHFSPYFGPIAEALNADATKYAALVSADSPDGKAYDPWTIGVLDLATGDLTQKALLPYQLSSTTSVSGFGIPLTSSVFHGP